MTVSDPVRPIRAMFDALTDAASRATHEMLDRAEQAEEAADDGEQRGHAMEYVRGYADGCEDAAGLLLDEMRDAERSVRREGGS